MSVIPSYYKTTIAGDQRSGHGQTSDTTLRVGRVVAAYDSTHASNRNKRQTEYDVSVVHFDSDGMAAKIIYPRCRISSPFGGATDLFRWTPRIDTFDEKTQVGFGSRVLLLCINGAQRYASIIGGIYHPEDGQPELPYDNNHHMEFQFNGMYANIDSEGTFTLIHRGATEADNTVSNTAGENASLQFDVDGGITLGYNWNVPTDKVLAVAANTDDLPYFALSKKNKQLLAYAPSDISSKTTAKYLIETTDGVKVNPNGSSQQAWMRATVYRDKQQTMHQNIMTQLTTLATTITSVATAISNAAIAINAASIALKPPIGGSTAGSVPIGVAGVALTLAGSTLSNASSTITQIMQEYQTFEGSSGDYLSPSHFHADKP